MGSKVTRDKNDSRGDDDAHRNDNETTPVVQRLAWHSVDGERYALLSMPLQSSRASRTAARAG